LVYDRSPEFAAPVSGTGGALAPGTGGYNQSVLSSGPQLAHLSTGRAGDDGDRHCLPGLTQWSVLPHPASDPLGLFAPHGHSAYLRGPHWTDLSDPSQFAPVHRDDPSGTHVRI